MLDDKKQQYEWISVKDKLPGVDEAVLLFHHDGYAIGHIELYNEGTYEWWYDEWNHNSGVYDNYVTHWMLLPEPPGER